MRSECPALRDLLIPDDVWQDFLDWHRKPDKIACHQSILLLAMRRGILGRLTSPVHRYLIDGACVRPELTQQYRKDLRERWMFEKDPIRRHHGARGFLGKLAELQFAEWLETHGWAIHRLEALGTQGSTDRYRGDIEATGPDGHVATLEVKLIGVEDDDFNAIVRSLAGESAARSPSPYDAANYLLFRVYECAKQLQRVIGRRTAIIVVQEMTWHTIELQTHNRGWIDWADPALYEGPWASDQWAEFLKGKRGQYPKIEADLGVAIGSLTEIWIVRQGADFDFERPLKVLVRSA